MPNKVEGQVYEILAVGQPGEPLPEDFNLLKHAMDHARRLVSELTKPDEDIIPVMIWRSPYGLGLLPMMSMEDQRAKDTLASVMTTCLAVARATEAVQITPSWAVRAAAPPEGEPLNMDVMPSEHPDRVECITAVYVTPEPGTDRMASAELVRHEDKPPELAEWADEIAEPTERIGGRFGDAMHMGMDLASEMPQQLVGIIDEGWAKGEQGDLIQRFHKVFSQFSAAMEAMADVGFKTGGPSDKPAN